MSAYVPRHTGAKRSVTEPVAGEEQEKSAEAAAQSATPPAAPVPPATPSPAALPATPSPVTPPAAPDPINSHPATTTVPPTPRRRRWPLMIALILALIVASGVATWYVLNTQAANREVQRTAAYKLLDEAIALIQESDQQVVALDVAVSREIAEADLPERRVLLERIPATKDTVQLAGKKAQEAQEMFFADSDRQLAQRVIDAAANREVLLESGGTLIANDIMATEATLLFGKAWELVVAQDTQLRAATELSRSGNYFELQTAIGRYTAIKSELERAQKLLGEARACYNVVNFAALDEYLLLKIESIDLAIAADQALLEADLDTVNARNAEFSVKDAAAVDAASRIPTPPYSFITSAYEAQTAEASANYASARANAADADRVIRDYVGVETQTGI